MAASDSGRLGFNQPSGAKEGATVCSFGSWRGDSVVRSWEEAERGNDWVVSTTPLEFIPARAGTNGGAG
jgi:hypothetical protein